jgi:hypothetical protein
MTALTPDNVSETDSMIQRAGPSPGLLVGHTITHDWETAVQQIWQDFYGNPGYVQTFDSPLDHLRGNFRDVRATYKDLCESCRKRAKSLAIVGTPVVFITRLIAPFVLILTLDST